MRVVALMIFGGPNEQQIRALLLYFLLEPDVLLDLLTNLLLQFVWPRRLPLRDAHAIVQVSRRMVVDAGALCNAQSSRAWPGPADLARDLLPARLVALVLEFT